MTQNELWLNKWQEAIDFLETNHRRPSKFVPEERDMRNWWKHNKKLMNAEELRRELVGLFLNSFSVLVNNTNMWFSTNNTIRDCRLDRQSIRMEDRSAVVF